MSAWQFIARLRGRNNEGMVALAIIALVIIVTALNPDFFSWATAFNVLRNSYEQILFALGVFLILVIGGIDVSFDAIGIFCGYSVAALAAHAGMGGGIWVMFLVAVLVGAGLGLINAAIVATFRLSTLIVTLGTRGIFAGFLLAVIGSSFINDLPPSAASFGSAYLARAHLASGGVAGLQVMVIPVAIICILIALGLSRTMLGRGAYAVGGDEEAARRAGFRVGAIKTLVFVIAGALAGVGGMAHVALIGYANPQDLVGHELLVIAAVVLGGASIFGGSGSVLGTILGVILIELIQYSLIILGIPSAFDHVAIGLLLLIGIVAQVAHVDRTRRHGLIRRLLLGRVRHG